MKHKRSRGAGVGCSRRRAPLSRFAPSGDYAALGHMATTSVHPWALRDGHTIMPTDFVPGGAPLAVPVRARYDHAEARAEAAESQLAKRDAEVGKLRAVLKLAGEFCHSVDAAAEDLGGGFRPLATILKELGPAVDAAARAALAPIPEKPTPAHDDADLEAAHCIRYQQARELD